MIEPRIYRAAFVPALFAVVLVMFSLESRPRPLPQGLAADVLFEGEQAAAEARRIASEQPDRRAGTAGDLAVADEVGDALRVSGFAVERQRFDHDGDELVNVIGRRAGRSRRQVVVVAARDATGVPDAAGSAADTAALIEIARVFKGRPSRKTLILASVDGSALGDVGTARLLDEVDGPDLVDGVLVVSGLGADDDERPAIVAWSNDTTRGGIALQRTAAESLREELEPPGPSASPAGQVARMAFPLGIGAQGVLLAEGYDAVRISGNGQLSDGSAGEPVDEDRLGALGRATLRTITALDQGPRPERGPQTYVTIAGQVMPGWVLAVLAGALILPVLVAGIDAFARARRRRSPVGPWLLWIAAGLAPFAIGYGLANLLDLFGATPEPPPAPVAPSLYPLDGAAIAVLAVVLAAVASSWVALRRFAGPTARRLDEASGSGAGVAVGLALGAGALVLWLIDPFAALVAVPAVHCWMLATLVDPPPARRVRFGLIAAGLVLPLLLAVYQLFVLGLDPLAGAWYLLLLVLGGQVGVGSVAVAALFTAVLGSVVTIARRSGEGPGAPAGEPLTPTTRGPLSYAGPGSLGGTDSALRR
ncbi:MAG TPA: hypothetical protein VHF88_10605 [Thermoleophilaceae bacterium]|nr:hypothetical protein [Thermoleophilaceae bacterium]